jgi:uncharacterized protein (TIGR02246 family)
MCSIKRFSHLGIIPILLLLTSCVSGNLTVPVQATQDEQQVRSVLDSYVAGRQARDVEAVESLLDPNVDQLTSRGEWRRGREAATAGMKRSRSTNPGDRTLLVETVRFLHPQVALADARYIIEGIDGPDRTLWSTFTLVRQPDTTWRITSIRNQEPAE